jgi:hypothetical protein
MGGLKRRLRGQTIGLGSLSRHCREQPPIVADASEDRTETCGIAQVCLQVQVVQVALGDVFGQANSISTFNKPKYTIHNTESRD